jgi:hypothetical protein
MRRWLRALWYPSTHKDDVLAQFAALPVLPEAGRMRTKVETRWPIAPITLAEWNKRHAA